MAKELLAQVEAGSAAFADVIAFIEAHYNHTPTAFKNGQQNNAATENQGSAKVFSFAQLKGLDQAQRIRLWKQSVAESQRLGDEFLEMVEKQNFPQFMQTL